MSAAEWIIAALIFAAAGVMGVLAVRHFAARGRLLNNAYLHASEGERRTMDKRPYYRQSAVVFCLLGVVFLVIGLSLVLHDDRLVLLEIPLLAAAVVYALVSSARIRRRAER